MKVLFASMILAAFPFSANAAGLYLCGNFTSEEYALIFQDKGALKGMLLVPGGRGPGGAMQIKCRVANAQEEKLACEPELPGQKAPEILLDLKRDLALFTEGERRFRVACSLEN
jgi:hypothetical protein